MSLKIPSITAEQIISRYDVILLDAFGVLVDAQGSLPGAAEFIGRLHELDKDYWVISNGCYCSPEESRLSYLAKGVPIKQQSVITAATIMGDILAAHTHPKRIKLLGARFIKNYLEQRASVIWVEDQSFDTVIIGDQEDLDFPRDIDVLITQITHKVKKAEEFDIYLPNPDIVYPQKPHHFGLTSGSLGLLVEHALKVLLGKERAPHITALGKPHAAIFQRAFQEIALRHDLKSCRMVMIGDQLQTDIRGGRAHQLDTVLMETGVSGFSTSAESTHDQSIRPHFRANSLKFTP